MPRDNKIHSENWGGTGRGQGRKQKWYGKTVTMRIPASWAVKLKYCMDNEITPIFDKEHKQDDKERNQINKVTKTKRTTDKYTPELITKALEIYSTGLSGGDVWVELNKLDFNPLPSRTNMKRTLDNWKKGASK